MERADSELLHAIQRLVAYQPGTDEQRIRCDLVTGRALRTELECIVADLTPDDLEPGGPPPGNAAPQVPAPQVPAPQAPATGVPATAGAQEPPAVPELASYLHYLLALLEVFSPRPPKARSWMPRAIPSPRPCWTSCAWPGRRSAWIRGGPG